MGPGKHPFVSRAQDASTKFYFLSEPKEIIPRVRLENLSELSDRFSELE